MLVYPIIWTGESFDFCSQHEIVGIAANPGCEECLASVEFCDDCREAEECHVDCSSRWV